MSEVNQEIYRQRLCFKKKPGENCPQLGSAILYSKSMGGHQVGKGDLFTTEMRMFIFLLSEYGLQKDYAHYCEYEDVHCQ